MSIPNIDNWIFTHPDVAKGKTLIDRAGLQTLKEAVSKDFGLLKGLLKQESDKSRWRLLKQAIENKIYREAIRYYEETHKAYERSTSKLKELFADHDFIKRFILEFNEWHPIIKKKGFSWAKNSTGEGSPLDWDYPGYAWIDSAPPARFINDLIAAGFFHLGFATQEWSDPCYGVYLNSFAKFERIGDVKEFWRKEYEKRCQALPRLDEFSLITYYQPFQKESYAGFFEMHKRVGVDNEIWLFDPFQSVPKDVKRDRDLSPEEMKRLSYFISPWPHDTSIYTYTSRIADALSDRFYYEWTTDQEFKEVHEVKDLFALYFKRR